MGEPPDPSLVEKFSTLLRPGMARRLRPLSPEAASMELQGNTNSGYPYFTRKSEVRAADLDITLAGDWFGMPAIAFARTTAHGPNIEDAQTREVFGFPSSSTIKELQYFVPWLEPFRRHPALSALESVEAVAASVSAFMAFAAEKHTKMYSTDFEGFDKSIHPESLRAIGREVAMAFQSSYGEELEQIFENVANIPWLITDEDMLVGAHGMPSGTGWTSGGDSIHHKKGQELQADLYGTVLNPWCQVQGDDGLLNFAIDVDDELMSEHWKQLGQTENPEKRFSSYSECFYLRRYYGEGLPGAYSTCRALNSILGRERFYDEEGWDGAMEIIRALMILENPKHNPLHLLFVDFVAQGDIYGLGAKWPGGIDGVISRRRLEKARGIRGFIPSYNQEDRLGGIRNFVTYRYLKEKENGNN